jgi:DNA-binding XRE family transcriptional regulator
MTKVQTFVTPGGEKLAVLPMRDYEAMRDALEAAEAMAVAAAVTRGELDALTADEVASLIDAASPLAFWRGKRGLTQSELGKAVGVSQGYIASLESGARKGDPGLFLRMAKALRVPMEAIVEESEQGPQD